MNTAIKARIIQIGDEQGVQLPQHLLEQSGLDTEAEVELAVEANQIVIRAAHHPRQGWDAQFAAMAAQGDDQLPAEGATSLTSWDQDEWEW